MPKGASCYCSTLFTRDVRIKVNKGKTYAALHFGLSALHAASSPGCPPHMGHFTRRRTQPSRAPRPLAEAQAPCDEAAATGRRSHPLPQDSIDLHCALRFASLCALAKAGRQLSTSPSFARRRASRLRPSPCRCACNLSRRC